LAQPTRAVPPRAGGAVAERQDLAQLAVEDHHLLGLVALAGAGADWDGLFDLGQVAWAEVDLGCAEGFRESFARACADERDDVVAAGERPGECDLRDRGGLRLGERSERVDECEVALEVLAGEPSCGGAEVVRGQRVGALTGPVAGEQAAGEDAVGGDAYAELTAGRQDLVLDPAREQ
jgi:hypothetical protein